MVVEAYSIGTPEGLTLAAHRSGPAAGPTVVFLHGGGQTRHSWKGAVAAFGEAGYHAIAYDARGHGDSDWSPDADYSFDALARDLVAVVADRRQPVGLVGASMGGMTAYMAEGRGLLDIAGLVLVDIAPTPSAAGGKRVAAFMLGHRDGFASLEEAADAVSVYYPERPRPNDLSGLRRNLRDGGDGRLYWHWDPRLFGDRPTSEPPDVAEWAVPLAPHIRAPMLLVHGDRSDVVNAEVVAETRRLIPHMEDASIQGAGHMIAGDRNDAFTTCALGFLERHLPR